MDLNWLIYSSCNLSRNMSLEIKELRKRNKRSFKIWAALESEDIIHQVAAELYFFSSFIEASWGCSDIWSGCFAHNFSITSPDYLKTTLCPPGKAGDWKESGPRQTAAPENQVLIIDWKRLLMILFLAWLLWFQMAFFSCANYPLSKCIHLL